MAALQLEPTHCDQTRLVLSQQAVTSRESRCFSSIAESELTVGILQMVCREVFTDNQISCNLLIGAALRKLAKNLGLAPGETDSF